MPPCSELGRAMWPPLTETTAKVDADDGSKHWTLLTKVVLMRKAVWWIICGSLAMQSVFLSVSMAADSWPQFRGPWANGHASTPGDEKPLGVPLHWSETENVKWKTPIPHKGWSTPVVMDGHIWLTTATEDGHEFFVVCVNAQTGVVELNKKLFEADDPEPLGNNMNCYASPTAVVEPGRVYIHFGTYGTACLDTTSFEVIWQRSDLPCRHYRGPGSSPAVWKDLLIVTMDGVDVQYLAALNKKSGKTVWKTDRTTDWDDLDADGKPLREGDLRKAYTTPLFIDVNGKPQMISIGARAAYAYDPANGDEIWKVCYSGYSNAASPVFGNGLAYIITGYGRTELYAVRVDGRGDVTDTHVVWKATRAMPRNPSPVLIGELLFTLSDSGVFTCLDALTGDEVWTSRLRGNYAASPLYADGRIYCLSREGVTTVFNAGCSEQVLATNSLESGFMASPAVVGNALILRTKTHLYRIEEPSGVQ